MHYRSFHDSSFDSLWVPGFREVAIKIRKKIRAPKTSVSILLLDEYSKIFLRTKRKIDSLPDSFVDLLRDFSLELFNPKYWEYDTLQMIRKGYDSMHKISEETEKKIK